MSTSHGGEQFGVVARHQRIRCKRTLRSVAREIGLSVGYIHDIERGKRDAPSPKIVVRWANALGVPPIRWLRLVIVERSSYLSHVLLAAFDLADIYDAADASTYDVLKAAGNLTTKIREVTNEADLVSHQ